MALFKDFGQPESDSGEWFVLGVDKDANGEEFNVRARVRRIPHNLQLRLEGKFGHEEMIADSRGFKRPQRVMSSEDQQNVLKEKACWAWTDCEGLEIEIGDQAGADHWSKLLGEIVQPGQKVKMDGRLTDPVKRRLFNADYSLAMWIYLKSQEQQAEHGAREKRLEGN